MYNQNAYELTNLLKEKKLKISFAESCTGGLMAKYITDISGSSKVLEESYVTYSEKAKNKILSVPFELIKAHSVVSGEVAKAMAEGLFKISECDIAVSITGVAGPNSDSYNNPVGLVFVGIASKHRAFSRKLMLKGSRDSIRSKACAVAFDIAKNEIKNFFKKDIDN